MIWSFKAPCAICWYSGRSASYRPAALACPQISTILISACGNADVFSHSALEIHYKSTLVFKLAMHWCWPINGTNNPAVSLQPPPAATQGIWQQIKGQRTNDLEHIPTCWYTVCLHDPSFFPILQGRNIQFKVKDYRASLRANSETLLLSH